ncbi:MAG: hypothetical protein ACRDRA_05565 [Pseudonocardiaceae bacterium]
MRSELVDTLDPGECGAEHVPDLTLLARLTGAGRARFVQFSVPQYQADAPGRRLAGRAAIRQWTAFPVESVSLPVRSPGAYLHPQLRRSPVTSRRTDGGSSR